jgi:hypothetical protein
MRHLGSAIAAASLAACTSYSTEHSSVQHTNHVEVRVYGNINGGPALSGEPVAFIDPDGTAQVIVTGTDGVARADVAPGSSITAVIDQLVPAGNPPIVESVLDVRDGDHIEIGFPSTHGLPAPATGAPPCGDLTLTATYGDVDPSTLATLQLTRHTDYVNMAYTDLLPAAPTVTAQVQGAGAPAAYAETEIVSTAQRRQWIEDTIDGCATSYQLDVGKVLLPWVDAPSIDAGAGVMHVPTAGGGAPAAVVASAMLQRGATYINWEIVSPKGGDLDFPALPPGLDSYLPAPGDAVGSASTFAIAGDGIAGYADAHQHADELVNAAQNRAILSGTRVQASFVIY